MEKAGNAETSIIYKLVNITAVALLTAKSHKDTLAPKTLNFDRSISE